MIRFLAGWWLLLLLAVAALVAVYVLLQLRRRAVAVRFTNVALLEAIAPRGLGWRRHVAPLLLVLALIGLTAGMAKPAVDRDVPLERATIVLAIDVSLSMKATDVEPDRFAAAKSAAKVFVDELPDNYNLALVAFAKNASVIVSPTKQHQQVRSAIDTLELKESTAIGEAIMVSLDAIATVPADGAKTPPPARIVLLSDGFTTSGIPNDEAAEAAATAQVPVSTIAFGTPEGTVSVEGAQVPVPVDGKALQEIADQTQGEFYSAASSQELRDVYRDLGSSIGHRVRAVDVTQWFIGIALVLTFAAAGFSLLWTSRMP